jgi:hypothetical protein
MHGAAARKFKDVANPFAFEIGEDPIGKFHRHAVISGR